MNSTIPTRNVVALSEQQGEAIWFLDTLVTTKLRAQDGGDYGLIEYRMGAGSSTPFHRHHDEDESLYVLEGELHVVLEDRALRAGPGAYVHLPRGNAHGLIAHSDARMLVLSKPDGFVELTRELGTPAPNRELPPPGTPMPEMSRLLEVASRYGIEILGPTPTPA
jgi:quercetin dioxygenase-like cupin family protein